MPPHAFGPFVFDRAARLLTRSSRPVHLTAKAVDLLELLISRRPEAVAKKQIHEALWPNTFVSDVSVTTLIFELRTALGETARRSKCIRTVHGFGYAFAVDEAAAAILETPFYVIYAGREVGLREGDNLLGRSRDCLVRLDSPRVSRHHARITIEGGGAAIEDCGSRNGTWVRGVKTDGRVTLRDGDDIAVAGISMVFRVLSTAHGTQATEATN